MTTIADLKGCFDSYNDINLDNCIHIKPPYRDMFIKELEEFDLTYRGYSAYMEWNKQNESIYIDMTPRAVSIYLNEKLVASYNVGNLFEFLTHSYALKNLWTNNHKFTPNDEYMMDEMNKFLNRWGRL